MPHIIFLPDNAIMLYRSWLDGVGWLAAGMLFALGVALWSLTEYVVHRFAFHTARTTEAVDGKLVAMMTLIEHTSGS